MRLNKPSARYLLSCSSFGAEYKFPARSFLFGSSWVVVVVFFLTIPFVFFLSFLFAVTSTVRSVSEVMRKKREKFDNCGSTNTEEEFPPLEFHVACLSLSVLYKLVLRKHSPDYLWLAATPIGFITSIIWPSHNHLIVLSLSLLYY